MTMGPSRAPGTFKLFVEEVKKIRESENAGKDLIHHR